MYILDILDILGNLLGTCERFHVSKVKLVYGLKLLTTNSPKDHAKGNSQGEVRYHMKLSSSCGTDRNFF